jgi:F0F1-type ATP synthase assembly protein I
MPPNPETMSDTVDYTRLSKAELQAEEKRLKKKELTSAVLIGVLIGVMVYGATRGGSWFLPVILPLLLIAGLVKGSLGIRNRLTDIGSAIRTKGSDGGS